MKKIFSFLVAFVMPGAGCLSAYAAEPPKTAISPRILPEFEFSLYVDTDDDNARTDYALRDTSILGYTDANVGFYTLTNAANSMHFKVLKINPYSGGVTATATDTKTPSSNSVTQLTLVYTDDYITVDGAFALYSWTTVRDCYAHGRWNP